MSYLIDGNNLLCALEEVMDRPPGRAGLCRMLENLADRPGAVQVVFDGPPPPHGVVDQLGQLRVDVAFSHSRPADELIIERIGANTAPRRLAVVSTDREIRTAARRRRCRSIRSEDFARELLAAQKTSRSAPDDINEKRQGLAEGQATDWLRYFDIENRES